MSMCFTNLQMGFGDVRAVMTSGAANVDNWRGEYSYICVQRQWEQWISKEINEAKHIIYECLPLQLSTLATPLVMTISSKLLLSKRWNFRFIYIIGKNHLMRKVIKSIYNAYGHFDFLVFVDLWGSEPGNSL